MVDKSVRDLSLKVPCYKVVLIGDSGVGKTNLLSRLSSNEFNDDFMTTIGDGNKAKAQIWDTAGQERYSSVMSTYYRNARGAILVYDISRRQTFESIEYWYNEFKQYASEDQVIMLVGNKNDLEDKRQVSFKEATTLAAKHDMLFQECSAKTGENVHQLFSNAMEDISTRDTKKLEPPSILLNSNTKSKTNPAAAPLSPSHDGLRIRGLPSHSRNPKSFFFTNDCC